ncbi:hypothetical protein FQA39_LY11279 [Lamprigera yunnana]|nr:hypothetical protein FQA39_LY11279 [Lamprigera yunnana]
MLGFSSLTEWSNLFTIISSSQFTLYTTFFLVNTLKSSVRLCYEANRTVEVLSSIKIHSLKVLIRNLVISKCLSLMNNKLEITAYKLFKIDMSLLHSIVASITIYLVIMVQFDLEVSKVIIAKAQNNTDLQLIPNFTMEY